MELAKTQQEILQRLKARGPQSIKILANQLDMTTMGVRQHITELAARDLVVQTAQTRQTRGRPVHFWQLSTAGHRHFPDSHADMAVQLIDAIRDAHGETSLDALVQSCFRGTQQHYLAALDSAGSSIEEKLQRLAELRSNEGFMCEIRLLPDGWMLIENHCPIYAAAKACQQFCGNELALFQSLLAEFATVVRSDHVLEGARRCAYKIQRR